MSVEYEHTGSLRAAQRALIELRRETRTLWWMSGGRGYDNMGRRELEHARTKLDELDHWLAAAARALNAGGKRARSRLCPDPGCGRVMAVDPETRVLRCEMHGPMELAE